MAPRKRAATKPAAPKSPVPVEEPERADASIVITVTGLVAVDGVAPGGTIPWDQNLDKLRRRMLAGLVSVTVNGDPISDSHIVARMEGA